MGWEPLETLNFWKFIRWFFESGFWFQFLLLFAIGKIFLDAWSSK